MGSRRCNDELDEEWLAHRPTRCPVCFHFARYCSCSLASLEATTEPKGPQLVNTLPHVHVIDDDHGPAVFLGLCKHGLTACPTCAPDRFKAYAASLRERLGPHAPRL